MNAAQQSAWDTVYTASLCAPGSGMELTREQALVLLDMMAMRGGAAMPAEPTEGALEAIRAIDGMRRVNSYMVYRALHDHLARPPAADAPRKVKVRAWAIIDARGGGILQLRPDPPSGVATGIERAVVLTGEYDAPAPPTPPTRTEWWVAGYAANGTTLSAYTASDEATRDSLVRSTCARPGCERVTIVAREVPA